MRRFDGFTIVETLVALAVAGVVIAGAMAGTKFFTKPTGKYEVTLDQLKELALGAENLDRDLREARQIVYPTPGAAPSRVLYLRAFDGSLVSYYYAPTLRQLRRARFELNGVPTEARPPPARDLDGAWFSVTDTGLVSWALFSPGRMLMGSVRRENQ